MAARNWRSAHLVVGFASLPVIRPGLRGAPFPAAVRFGARLLTGIAAHRAYVGLFLGGENVWWIGRRPQEVAAAWLHNGLSPLLLIQRRGPGYWVAETQQAQQRSRPDRFAQGGTPLANGGPP